MSAWRHAGIVLAVKAAIGALVLAGGFRAVSDDDFARVVLAQQWTASPKLDPTGSSWLPLPFWIYGAVMRVAGATLDTARVTAFVLGLLSAVLVYAAARLLLRDPRDALWGALIAAVLPWSARLGVATVPELPAAALTVFAVATLAVDRLRSFGALALIAATLSRYEPWPVAGAFALICLWDARERRHAAWGALACVGPLVWLAHNALVHGDALHFAARVSAYQQALGASAQAYPLALVRGEPELVLVALGLAAWRLRPPLPRDAQRVAGVLALMLVALSLAAIPGGAPTHHSGRALLAIWLVVAIYVGAGARWALRSARRLVFAGAVALAMLGGVFVRRTDAFLPRTHETAIGRLTRSVAARERVLVEAVDYGYFAIVAASAHPDAMIIDRSLDPRGTILPSSFASVATLRRRASAAGARYAVATTESAARELGEPLARAGPWGLWSITP